MYRLLLLLLSSQCVAAHCVACHATVRCCPLCHPSRCCAVLPLMSPSSGCVLGCGVLPMLPPPCRCPLCCHRVAVCQAVVCCPCRRRHCTACCVNLCRH